MKIGTPTPPVTGGAEALRPSPAGGHAPSATPRAGSTNDSVAVSRLADLLAQGERAMETTAEIDVTRVQEISQAIRDGRFHIDPERIADGLLAGVRDFLILENR